MFKIEIITTYENRHMCEKEILYTDTLEKAQWYVDERKDIETNNQFIFIEETHDACKIQIDIPDFYINSEKATWNDFIEVERIIEQKYVNNAINDYINSDF